MTLRAITVIGRMDRSQYTTGGDYLARAIELEPDYASAHAWYAYWHVFLVGQGWADDLDSMMAKAGALAERAIVLDPLDARGRRRSVHPQLAAGTPIRSRSRRRRAQTGRHARSLRVRPETS
jgi:hypothetical protein